VKRKQATLNVRVNEGSNYRRGHEITSIYKEDWNDAKSTRGNPQAVFERRNSEFAFGYTYIT
jgi:hypothetical protein